jgi:hypothetical protein
VADAKKLNDNGKGWTCFGGPGIGGAGTIADLGNTSWLGGWAPGQGLNKEPADTGVPLPVGSEIVMQIHYNLLVGDKPNQSKVVLTTVPEANSSLIPLHIDLYPTAIDIPCPTGQTGPLCSRSASLADIGHRFGQSAVNFDNLLEEICNNGTPVPSDTTSCNWPIPARSPTVYLWRITPHMHLLGESMTVTLNQGQSDQRVLLDEPYNFHDQRAWDMSTPVAINGGDTINVSCMFNPTNRLTDPYLKNLPPRYVMWADGSSDEMCLAIMGVTYSLPSGVTPAVAHASTGYSWPAQVSSSAAKASPAFLGTKDINKMVRDEKLLAQLQRVIGFCGVS